jgi:hypothetical protein
MIPDNEGGYKRQANAILSLVTHFRPPHRCWRVLPPKRPKTFSLRVSEFADLVAEKGETRLDSFTGEGSTGRNMSGLPCELNRSMQHHLV